MKTYLSIMMQRIIPTILLFLLEGSFLLAQQVLAENKAGDLRFIPGTLSTKIYYEGAETIGRVGHEAILKRDVLHQLKKHAYLTWLNQIKEMSPEQRETQGTQIKKQILDEFLSNPKIYSDVLDGYIKKLLFYNDFVVSSPKEQAEDQRKRLREVFDQEYLPHLMKEIDVNNRKDLETFFVNELQSTLEQDRRIFLHETIGSSWLEYNLGEDKFEPMTVDLRRYYESHLDLFRQAERVDWGAMTVLFSNHPNREEAHQKIVEMGNMVLRARTKEETERIFEEVCKNSSEDFFASKGGKRGWTGRGVLQSQIIEDAIFNETLPVSELSRIIQDSLGYSILLVYRREKTTWTPFIQVQEEVRKKLLADRRVAMINHYEEKLSRRFTIELYNITDAERKFQLEANQKEHQSVTGRNVF